MLTNKIEELIKSNELLIDKLLHREAPVIVEKKKTNPLLIMLGIIGAITIVASLAYVFTRLFFDREYEKYDDLDDIIDDESDKQEASTTEDMVD